MVSVVLPMNDIVHLIIFLAFKAGNVSLIFRTSDMLVKDLEA